MAGKKVWYGLIGIGWWPPSSSLQILIRETLWQPLAFKFGFQRRPLKIKPLSFPWLSIFSTLRGKEVQVWTNDRRSTSDHENLIRNKTGGPPLAVASWAGPRARWTWIEGRPTLARLIDLDWESRAVLRMWMKGPASHVMLCSRVQSYDVVRIQRTYVCVLMCVATYAYSRVYVVSRCGGVVESFGAVISCTTPFPKRESLSIPTLSVNSSRSSPATGSLKTFARWHSSCAVHCHCTAKSQVERLRRENKAIKEKVRTGLQARCVRSGACSVEFHGPFKLFQVGILASWQALAAGPDVVCRLSP